MLMYTQKKRSLNEIRQTKDSHYIVPQSIKKCISEKVLDEYFNNDSDQSVITKENYTDFIDFLSLYRYKITKE
mgnify:CR=1 FL=1